ncbi:hypothetical protein [Rhodopirellula sallentina]|uniref:Secreted protein n=1 Tax=Rhodopirellula sallentina SM41 TaxID=1263870 RepID=M5UKZ8_9BACT|nr:hypothetical protein [Rhodopirellula sallentina]EMI56683.1 secreted protein [Rhodopirellula sallentina SM41]
MKSSITKLAIAASLCLTATTLPGCGNGDPSAPSPDAVTNFLDNNPELIEESKRRAEEEAAEAERATKRSSSDDMAPPL